MTAHSILTATVTDDPDHRWMRMDAARILGRFFYLERALTLAAAGWIPGVGRLETKALLSRLTWQSALTGDAARTRVFELRYPNRMLVEGSGRPIIRVFEAAINAPSGTALLYALQQVLVPELQTGYRRYVEASDHLADAPSGPFLRQALEDKEEQLLALGEAIEAESGVDQAGIEWAERLGALLGRLGGVCREVPEPSVDVPDVVEGGRTFELAQDPVRDDRYLQCSFYWPDVLDPTITYGEDVSLQIRVGISHLNEVWAVETAGALLHGLEPELGWEFITDAARWAYDEGRHMLMGQQRMADWGFDPARVPLSPFIYEACREQDPIYRLGMLGYFETKNINKKPKRAQAFSDMGDATSKRHMEFDWADETIHAEYGRRWLKALLETRGQSAGDYAAVLERCEQLVAARIAAATPEDRRVTEAVARDLVEAGRQRANRNGAAQPL